jgi:radical SAM protein with 4Fe4S-binding SPASM domain
LETPSSKVRCNINFQCELTSYCDLTCGYCPNKDMERQRAFMSDEVWQAILHRYVVPYKDRNRFCPPTFIGHKDGEPLLNKALPDRLTDLSVVASDMKIDIYSHGLMLPKWAARGEDFIDFLGTLPNHCRYLMSFHPHNHDGSSNAYTPVMLYLREKLRNPPPNVEFITVSHKSKWVTEAMQESWRQWWAGLPITVHSNASLNPWTGRIEEEGTVKFSGCPYGDFGHWFFGATGNIIACCLDLEEEIILGNVLKDDPEEMFQKTAAFYADQRAKKVDHAVCHNCHGLPPAPGRLVSLGLLK